MARKSAGAAKAALAQPIAPSQTPPPYVDESKLVQMVMEDGKLATEHFRVVAIHLRCLLGAMARGDDRTAINGIFLDLDPQYAPTLVATNGHIMARAPAIVDFEAHQQVLSRLIWDRKQKTDPATGAPIWSNPDHLIFAMDKLPAAASEIVAVDLALGRVWDPNRPGSKYERHITGMPSGRYPDWRRVVRGDPGCDSFKPSLMPQPVSLDLAILTAVWNGPVLIEPGEERYSMMQVTLRDPRVADVKVNMMQYNPR